MSVSSVHATPLGDLVLTATARALLGCVFVGTPGLEPPVAPGSTPVLEQAGRELDAYFAGTSTTFTVPVDLSPRPAFDRQVLALLGEVGAGTTTTYGALAAAAGLDAASARRVGGVLARNPLHVVVPCHRVVAADGALTGYAGGLGRKRALLDLEAAAVPGAQLTLS